MTKPSRTSAGRSARYKARNPAAVFGVEVDLSGFDAALNAKTDEIEAAARPAAQAGAQVLYDAVLRNVASIGVHSGNLRRAIYQAHSPERSSRTRQSYNVSWNPRKAPHGHLVEYGHVQKFAVYFEDGRWYTNKKAPPDEPRQIAARPFVRPAIGQFPQAQAAMKAEFLRRIGGGT